MEEEKSQQKTVKTNQVLANYIQELSNDVKLSEYNIREKSMMCGSIWAKWLNYLFLEKENLSRIAEAKKKILANKMSENKASDSILRLKSEEKISNSDEKIQKLNVLSKQTQDNIDYIERALNILQNFGFQIKNSTELLKLQLTH